MGENQKDDLNIGAKIRKMRKIRGITLGKLAEETGMSYSYLSELENNKHSISISNLQKLASYFEIDLIHFLEKTERKNTLIRKKDRNTLKTEDGILFQTISSEAAENLQITFITLPPNTPEKRQQHIHKHPQGEEFITITKGEAIVVVEEEKYVLKEGDAVIFPSNKEHVIFAEEKGAELILIGAPPYGRDYLEKLRKIANRGGVKHPGRKRRQTADFSAESKITH